MFCLRSVQGVCSISMICLLTGAGGQKQETGGWELCFPSPTFHYEGFPPEGCLGCILTPTPGSWHCTGPAVTAEKSPGSARTSLIY